MDSLRFEWAVYGEYLRTGAGAGGVELIALRLD